MIKENYPACEKLKQKRLIDLLFAKGKWQTCGSLRIITLNLEAKPQEGFSVPMQKVGVSAPKRNFKKAVDRNRIKRLLREAYRKNKIIFEETFGAQSLSMLFWVSKEKPAGYAEVEKHLLDLCKSKK